MNTESPNYDFPTLIPKFDAILSRGLQAGLGSRYRQMCIETAICAALDLPHGDDPKCVARSVRTYNIILNDARWSTSQARAAGLRNLGIAQIGSAGVVDEWVFAQRLVEDTIHHLLPRMFRENVAAHPACLYAADRCEQADTLEDLLGAARTAWSQVAAVGMTEVAEAMREAVAWTAGAAAWMAGAAVAVGPVAEVVAAATGAVAGAANAVEIPGGSDPDRYLLMSAQLALQILIDLKSPGAAWIDYHA